MFRLRPSDSQTSYLQVDSDNKVKEYEHNVLVVDEYEMIPDELQRTIQEIAAKSGAKSKIVTIEEELTEEDREMDQLMLEVYQKVSAVLRSD